MLQNFRLRLIPDRPILAANSIKRYSLGKKKMRDYLYFWHDSEHRYIVASGIELKDLAVCAGDDGGLLLLAHGYTEASFDFSSRFDYVQKDKLFLLKEVDAYTWGDICWIDYAGDSFPSLTPQDIAELLYFRHTGIPLGRISIPNLRNKFLFSGHDDGWFLKIFYESWVDVARLLVHLPLLQNIAVQDRVLDGRTGSFWIDLTGITEEDATSDIDSILNKRIKQSPNHVVDPTALRA